MYNEEIQLELFASLQEASKEQCKHTRTADVCIQQFFGTRRRYQKVGSLVCDLFRYIPDRQRNIIHNHSYDKHDHVRVASSPFAIVVVAFSAQVTVNP